MLYLANSYGNHRRPRMSQGAERPAPQCCSLDGLLLAISAGVNGAASQAGLWRHWILNYDWPDRQNEQHPSVAGDTAHPFIASGMTWLVLVFVLLMVFQTRAAFQHPATAISPRLLRTAFVF